MINLKPEDLTEWNGFDVYDAETGDDISPSEMAKREFPQDKWLLQCACGYCLTWDVLLYLLCDDGNTVYIQKNGRYLVQINGEKYMRW